MSELTRSKLELEGVQVTFTVRVGDWTRHVSVSPIEYKTFKRWDEIYAETVVEQICRSIDHEIEEDK